MSSNEIRDALPDDLDISAFVGPYQFPDNNRRRIPGFIYLGMAAVCALLWLTSRSNGTSVSGSGLVNDGMLFSAIGLGLFGLFVLSSSWKMTVDEKTALVFASRAVGFAVGHSSAQQVWRGFRSRPTWRVFCYSAEEPPLQRGLVLVDAINAQIVECLVEANPDK
jgi:hypothetical protein